MAESRPKVTVIVLAWNRWALTERCLATLRENTDPARAEILVVDNGSTDETPAKLKDREGIRILSIGRNVGFVRGNNVGIASAPPENDVVLLNNDVEILKPDWLERLQATAYSGNDVGVVGCRLRFPDGRLIHAGTYILPDTLWGQQVGALEKDVNQYAADREVEGIVFACAYLKRSTLRTVGELSEEYESYFEDTDYCLRAREKGLKTVVCGSVTILHHEHGSTSDAPEAFRKLFERSRKTFGSRWRKALVARYRHELSWQSVMNFSTGYAMSCREYLRNLDHLGVHLSYSFVYGPGTPQRDPEPASSGDYMLDVIAGRKAPARPPVSVVYAQGDVFHKNRGRYRVGFTMLEVDGFVDSWVKEANAMDEVWVPTTFNRDGFLASGLKKPVHVIPLGVDTDHFHPGIRAHRNPSGDFVFLSNFEWGERKRPELLLKAFNQTFRHDEPVVLVCKVMHRNRLISVKRQVEALRLRDSGGRIAFLYNRDFPYHQLASLYRSADCYVSAGRGEGWDMPLMEAMACGLPTIATDWGAHTDFVHDGISYPLRVNGTIPARALCPYYEGFSWADPDPVHLAELLRHVYENREEAAAKGRRAASEMIAKWTWEKAARKILDRLEAIGA